MIDWLIIYILCIPLMECLLYFFVIKNNKDFIVKYPPLPEYNPKHKITIDNTKQMISYNNKTLLFHRRNKTHNR